MECVTDATPGGRVFEVPGVAGQDPTRPGRLPEVALEPQDPIDLGGPVGIAQRVRDRRAAVDMGHQRPCQIPAEHLDLVFPRRDTDQVEPAVGRPGENVPVAPPVEDERRCGAEVRTLEIGPVVDSLTLSNVVTAGAGHPGHGRVPPVGTDDQPGPDLALAAVAQRPHADHPPAFGYQRGHPGPQPYIRPGVGRRAGQDRIEQVTPDRGRSAHIAQVERKAGRETEVAEPDIAPGHEGRPGRPHLVDHAQPVQERQ